MFEIKEWLVLKFKIKLVNILLLLTTLIEQIKGVYLTLLFVWLKNVMREKSINFAYLVNQWIEKMLLH